MKIARILPLIFVTAVTGCGPSESSDPSAASSSNTEAAISPTVNASPSDLEDCNRAKSAGVAAREIYNRDYEARNPGVPSGKWTVNQFTKCRLTDKGAFISKSDGLNWRFIPEIKGKYSENPKEVWGDEDGIWFSEWRSEMAPDAKSEELSELLKSAREVE